MSSGTTSPASASPAAKHDSRGRQHGGGDPDRDGGHHDRRGHRDQHPQHEVLHRLDVGDHAAEQVGAAVRGQAGRRQRHQRVVDPAAQRRQRPQRGVVAGQPLGVAEDAAAGRERPHPDDGQRQRGQRRLLGGAGEQPGGGAHQRQRRPARWRPTRTPRRAAGPRAATEQAGQPPHHQLTSAASGTGDARRAHDVTTRSASSTMAGRCATTSTVRPGHQPRGRLDDGRLAAGVEPGRRLVQQQQRGVAQERAGQCDALALPRGQPGAALAQRRLVAARQPVDELVGVRQRAARHDLVVGRAGPAEPDVLGDGPGEQVRPLRHPGQLPPPRLRVGGGEVGHRRRAPARTSA